MMTISHLLEDFGPVLPGGDAIALLSESVLEEQNLDSFEKGYAAGWEDSLAMQIEEKSRLSETMVRNLEDLNFTFTEAYQQMLASVTPVLGAVIDRALPEMLRDTIGPQILEQARAMVGDAADYPVRICVPPGQASQVRPVVSHALGLDVTVTEDPAFTDDQVAIRVGDRERIVDADGLIREMRQAIAAFSHDMQTGVQYGGQ